MNKKSKVSPSSPSPTMVIKSGSREQFNKLSYHRSGVIVHKEADPYGYCLFAARHFSPGDVITEYCGNLIDADMAQDHSNEMKSHYRTLVSQRLVIDGIKHPIEGFGAGSFANHYHPDKINATFLKTTNPLRPSIKLFNRVEIDTCERIFLMAIRNIPPGTEINVNYGNDYWLSRDIDPKQLQYQHHYINGLYNLPLGLIGQILSYLPLVSNYIRVSRRWAVAFGFKFPLVTR